LNGILAELISKVLYIVHGRPDLPTTRSVSGFKDTEHFAECSSRRAYYLTNMKSVLDHGKDLRSKYDW